MNKTWSEKKAPRQFVRVLMRFASRANLNELFENNYERREKQRTTLLNAMMPSPASNNDQSEDNDRYELLQISMNHLLFGICRPYIYKYSQAFLLFLTVSFSHFTLFYSSCWE